jgi:hypothetical protein
MAPSVKSKSAAISRASVSALVFLALGSCNMGQHISFAGAAPSTASHAGMTMPGVSESEAAILVYRPVAPVEAVKLNAAIPISTEPMVPARAFLLSAANVLETTHAAAVDCLTAAIYYEAATESEAGQRAVAQVVLNRMRHPAYPKSICGVVFQGSERTTGCQFTFTCDGSLSRMPEAAMWSRARRFAEEALAGHVEKSVGLSTHYHTIWVVPYWRNDLTKLAVIGAHIFYRWTGSWGQNGAFRGAYAAAETLPPKLASSIPQALLSTVGVATEQSADPDGAAPPAALAANAMPTLPRGWVAPAEVSLPKSRQALAADDNRAQLLVDESRGILAQN